MTTLGRLPTSGHIGGPDSRLDSAQNHTMYAEAKATTVTATAPGCSCKCSKPASIAVAMRAT